MSPNYQKKRNEFLQKLIYVDLTIGFSICNSRMSYMVSGRIRKRDSEFFNSTCLLTLDTLTAIVVPTVFANESYCGQAN
jgi:hypothetical protein